MEMLSVEQLCDIMGIQSDPFEEMRSLDNFQIVPFDANIIKNSPNIAKTIGEFSDQELASFMMWLDSDETQEEYSTSYHGHNDVSDPFEEMQQMGMIACLARNIYPMFM